jgi:hypothetical protein
MVVLVLCTFGAHAKDGITCGSTVSTSLTLQSDIGPCPGPALIVEGASTDVTIDLNGHKITGQGTGIGIFVSLQANVGGRTAAVTVKGPGQIIDLGTGIEVRSDSEVLVYDLALRNNGIGVMLRTGGLSVTRVHSNIIDAGRTGSVGVIADGRAYVYQNTISGHSESAVILGEGDNVVAENMITQNRVGIESARLSYVCFAIRGNRILDNVADGMNLLPKIGSTITPSSIISGPCFQIEDNLIRSNGGSGIVTAWAADMVVQNNIVQSNRMNGLKLAGPGVIQVFGNRIQGNRGMDLLWDAVTSPGVCGSQNIADKQAQPLPHCLP